VPLQGVQAGVVRWVGASLDGDPLQGQLEVSKGVRRCTGLYHYKEYRQE